MRDVVIGSRVPVIIDGTVLIPLFLFWSMGFLQLFSIALVFSLLHECAHLLAARALGYTPKDITINMFGEVLHLREEMVWPEHQILIHLAGPCFNLLTAFLCFLLLRENPGLAFQTSLTPLGGSFFMSGGAVFSPAELLLIINLFLALFNLIPFFPLDGGKVVAVYLSYYLGREKGISLSLRLGKIFSFFNFLLGLYLIQYNLLNGLISALAVSLYAACRKEEKRRLFLALKRAGEKQETGVWYG